MILTMAIVMRAPTAAQTNDKETTHERDRIKATIASVFERNLSAGITTIAPGVQAYTRVPPSDSDLREIAAYGSKAIPILSEYLASTKPRVQELAVRSIAYIGGPEAVPPLERAAISSKYQAVRLQAVLSLAPLPGDEVDSALSRIAETGSDDRIRGKAAEILSQRAARPPGDR